MRISINEVSFANVTTSSNGQASFNWQPTSTGNYTVVASYTATGSTDTGYMPGSASTIVNAKPQTIINTQTTGSGTQSVTFNTAQGQPGAGAAPNLQILFPSLGQIVVKLNGVQVCTASMSNSFGWSCVAKVFGTCVVFIPYWQVIVVATMSELLNARFIANTLGTVSRSVSLSIPAPSDDLAFESELATSGTIGLANRCYYFCCLGV